ncbi:hypothetical protein PR202_ga16745 [Eleusine coracana subsp. coracana]|uniref:Uncharacterized protein n=1 Tax=Eleusine coracana subsp. coracana TaxID=191504 RepID=A0AAV5CNI5_ELECO|nr:hypothetical protein QOZ80_6AG0524940 [Eleusine coracana subsp. coracana]GJM99625.1 hypothetical protein PR202_ga16745 [Eleusine coracana subsp. coracana]
MAHLPLGSYVAAQAPGTVFCRPPLRPSAVAYTATLDNSISGIGGSICEFSIEDSYSLRYQTKISSKISPDRIADLQGVSVKVLFLWLNIVEVTRSIDKLGLSIGIAADDFGIENFLECPTCGCDFNCNDLLREPGSRTANLRLRGAF